MKKLMTMTAMLALMLVAAAPAFAQSTAIGGDVDFVDSDQAQFALTQQVNFDNDQDLAGVAQSLEVEQDQSLAAEDSVAAGGASSDSSPEKRTDRAGVLRGPGFIVGSSLLG